MKIEIKILNKEFYKKEKMGGEYYDLPDYQTFGSAAVDLHCTEDIQIHPGETKMLSTGLAIWIGSCQARDYYEIHPNNQGYSLVGIVVPRSGLGTKGLVLANTVGIIDEDYQGELKISAWNRCNEYKTIDRHNHEGDWQEIEWNTDDTIQLEAGDRIAQLLFLPVIKASWQIVDEFSNKTARDDGGFGSTGVGGK